MKALKSTSASRSRLVKAVTTVNPACSRTNRNRSVVSSDVLKTATTGEDDMRREYVSHAAAANELRAHPLVPGCPQRDVSSGRSPTMTQNASGPSAMSAAASTNGGTYEPDRSIRTPVTIGDRMPARFPTVL